MKKTVLKKILFTHAHLIVDERREYLDGSLAVEDGRIRNVFPQSDRLYGDLSDYPLLDMKGSILLPAFACIGGDPVPEEGILNVLEEEVPPAYQDIFRDASVSEKEATPFAKALADEEAYKSFRCPPSLPAEDLQILLKVSRRDRLILLPEEGKMLEEVRRLRELGLPWRSIVAFTSRNLLAQQGRPASEGSFARGNEARLLALTKEGERLFVLDKEVLQR